MVKVTVRLESAIFNGPAFKRSLIQVVTRSTFELETAVKLSIQQGSKTGRVYRRGAIKKVVGARNAKGLKRSGNKFVVGFRFHRASAPGQAPATDTGNLVNSMKAERAVSDARGIHGSFVVNAKYGAILEHGGGHMAARPYIAPQIKKLEPKFRAAVDSLVARAVA